MEVKTCTKPHLINLCCHQFYAVDVQRSPQPSCALTLFQVGLKKIKLICLDSLFNAVSIIVKASSMHCIQKDYKQLTIKKKKRQAANG